MFESLGLTVFTLAHALKSARSICRQHYVSLMDLFLLILFVHCVVVATIISKPSCLHSFGIQSLLAQMCDVALAVQTQFTSDDGCCQFFRMCFGLVISGLTCER